MSSIRRLLLVGILSLCMFAAIWAIVPASAQAEATWSDLPSSLLDTYGLKPADVDRMSRGYPDGTWRPYEPVRREQFVIFALRYFGLLPAEQGLAQAHFSDVPESSPYFGWVEAALEIGLVHGYQSAASNEQAVFGLEDLATREQSATILTRYLTSAKPSSFDYSTYTDERCDQLLAPFVDKDQVTQRREVAMAIDTQILRVPGSALMPKADLSRIQAAALVARTGLLAPPQEPTTTTQPGPIGDSPLLLLFHHAQAAGIEIEQSAERQPAPWMPLVLWLRARVEVVQDPAVYEATAETLVSLAEEYRDRLGYEQVHVLLVAQGGEVVYEHVFGETTPATTTTTVTAPTQTSVVCPAT